MRKPYQPPAPAAPRRASRASSRRASNSGAGRTAAASEAAARKLEGDRQRREWKQGFRDYIANQRAHSRASGSHNVSAGPRPEAREMSDLPGPLDRLLPHVACSAVHA
jgi:hypothetical protein